MKRFLGGVATVILLVVSGFVISTPSQADTATLDYSVTVDDPLTHAWPNATCYFSPWTRAPQHAVWATATVTVTGSYDFVELPKGDPLTDGEIAILEGPYVPPSVSNCLGTADDIKTEVLSAGTTYTLLLSGGLAALGDFSYQISGPGLFEISFPDASGITAVVSPTSVTVGDPVNLSALVTSTSPSADLSGTVEFFDDGSSLGTGTVDAVSGSAVLSAIQLPVGTHSITATYSGNSGTASSTTPEAVSVTVKPAAAPAPTPPKRIETAAFS